MYEGVSEATAGQLLRVPADEEEKSALTEAKEFLLSELGRFPVLANAVKRSAREADISERTLKRAKQALELPPIGDPLRPAAGTTLPTVAGPGFSDEPAYGDDHL